MLVKASTRFQVNDAVRHVGTGEVGKVVRIESARYFVTWESGKTWIYPGCDLEPTD